MKITSENINSEDCSIVESIDLKDQIRRISSAWLSLRESGRVKDCQCKRVLNDFEAIRKTAGGFFCKYLFTKVYHHQETHQFAVWAKNRLNAEIKDYNRFGELLFFDAVKGEFERSRIDRREQYDLFDYAENQSSGCDQCEIDFLVQEAFEIEESGE